VLQDGTSSTRAAGGQDFATQERLMSLYDQLFKAARTGETHVATKAL
jgi:hypothetical protein